MSARSFPLNAEVHITDVFVTPRVRLFAARACSSGLRYGRVVGAEREPSSVGPNRVELSRMELNRTESGQNIARAACAARLPSLVHTPSLGVEVRPSRVRTPGLTVGFRGDHNRPWPSTITYPACPE
ncbi:hypothetical protein GCM10010392_25310 [Streptomyces clavifer]|nr:hypothetical protein GCM10010392_25310 [Streptomyces clavifer]